jgi:hypothetical protein
MANDPYYNALNEIMSDTSPACPTDRMPADIEADILVISKTLKGPLSNLERLWLVEDRQILRKQLAATQKRVDIH